MEPNLNGREPFLDRQSAKGFFLMSQELTPLRIGTISFLRMKPIKWLEGLTTKSNTTIRPKIDD